MNLNSKPGQFFSQIEPPQRLGGNNGGKFVGNDQNSQKDHPRKALFSTEMIL